MKKTPLEFSRDSLTFSSISTFLELGMQYTSSCYGRARAADAAGLRIEKTPLGAAKAGSKKSL